MHALAHEARGSESILRLRRPRASVRPVAIALTFLLAAPLAPLARGADTAPADPRALLDVPVEALRLSPETAWRVSGESPLALHAQAHGDLRADRVALPTEGVRVFAFRVHVGGGGALRFLVDGETRQTFRAGDAALDVALSGAERELAWELVPASPGDAVDLVLVGARASLPPVVTYVTRDVWTWCGSEPRVEMRVRFAAPVDASMLRVQVGDRVLAARVNGWMVAGTRVFDVSVPAPGLPDGVPQALGATITDATGRVWDLVDLARSVTRHDVHGLSATPGGWVYDLRPTLALESACLDPSLKNARLVVDGRDVSRELRFGGYAATWTFPRDLPFGETHAYAFSVTLRDGTLATTRGALREGFDVMEWDAPSLSLLWTRTEDTPSGAEALFADLADPLALPPVAAQARVAAPPQEPLSLPEGAHLRAVFAPLGISCERRVLACAPYTGEAPVFEGAALLDASLTVSTPEGRAFILPAAGQFAAASRLGSLGHDPSEVAAWAQARADEMVARANLERPASP